MPSILYKKDASPPARAVMMIIDILGLDHIEQRDLNPVLREQDAPEIKKVGSQFIVCCPCVYDSLFS